MFFPSDLSPDNDSQDPWAITAIEGTYDQVKDETVNRHQNAVNNAKTLDTPFEFPKSPILFSDLTDLKGGVMTHKITTGWYIVMPVSCVGRICNDLRHTTAQCSLIPK